jgi:mRNA-degrading endonuclease toxin of MazEF toxin-antitoxin module
LTTKGIPFHPLAFSKESDRWQRAEVGPKSPEFLKINQFSQLVGVVPLTKNTTHLSPSHVVIPQGTARLIFTSKVVTEQIKAVDKQRIVRRLGSLTTPALEQVERALKNTLAFP